VPQDQAEAHAEAARDFIMVELATKADLLATKQELQTELRHTKQELRTSITELQTELHHTKQELQTSIETLSLRLTVRVGAIVLVGIGAVATIHMLT
jgi:chromosome segregation ATPase